MCVRLKLVVAYRYILRLSYILKNFIIFTQINTLHTTLLLESSTLTVWLYYCNLLFHTTFVPWCTNTLHTTLLLESSTLTVLLCSKHNLLLFHILLCTNTGLDGILLLSSIFYTICFLHVCGTRVYINTTIYNIYI